VIGMLRDDDDDGEGGWAGSDDAVAPPQPTLCDVPALVEESRAAGARVALRLAVPDDDAVPAAVGRTAYRIVQEGLTNARKHAPGAAVEVDVVVSDGEGLVVRVASRAALGVGVAARGGPRPPGAGTGLIGLGERVALAGGSLTHGPDRASGDFVLRAVLPA
jgi:signal transduction histidine kinase